MKDELKYKIPKEVFEWFHTNGHDVNGKYMFYPFWMEIIDAENNIVKMHHQDDLPHELEQLIRPIIAKDEYLIEGASYERLLKEYRQWGSLVIAFDFDNTVFDFHSKGVTYNQVTDLLRRLHTMGCYLICFTANEDLMHVRKHLNEKYIPYDGINCNPPFFKSKAKKIYYNALLDDRSGLLQTYRELLRLVDEVAFDYLKQ